jgi:inner membrane protein
MDPIAHTFTGMALAAAGLRRATPLAAAALFMGVNAPDVDVFSGFVADYASLAFRRGWTHGVLALALWPFVLTGILLVWDRYVRLRRKRGAAPARAGPLLALTALAVASHPTLDWLNNYGLRWLMPFDGRWFYGDALFVIDPWFWLLVGGAAFLTYSQSKLARVRWAVFFALATALIVLNTTLVVSNAAELVPTPSAVVWTVGVAALVAARWWLRGAPPALLERTARAGLAMAAVYVVAMLAASAAARNEVRAAAAAQGIVAEDAMVGPLPANPLQGHVVVMTPDEYYVGRFDWLGTPRVSLDGDRLQRPRGAVFDAAAAAPAARRFLVWARYPAVEIEKAPSGGTLVRFADVRYRATDRLLGPVVEIPDTIASGSD